MKQSILTRNRENLEALLKDQEELNLSPETKKMLSDRVKSVEDGSVKVIIIGQEKDQVDNKQFL